MKKGGITMKQLIVSLTSVALISFFGMQETVAEAARVSEERYCRPPEIYVEDSNNGAYWEYTVRKHDLNFVLDYFQDPDENGVSLTVTIRAMPLLAIYSQWEDVCRSYETPQPGRSPCRNQGTSKPEGGYAYWARSCVAQPPEETYRSIEKRTISVWLEPSAGTRDILGRGPFANGAHKPVLRYLYPDQWTAVVVRPADWETIGRQGVEENADVEKSLGDGGEEIVFNPDVTQETIVSRLSKIQSPATGRDALLLFGLDDRCRVNLAAVKDRDVCSYSVTEKIPGYGVSRFTLTLNRIPLDVPGEWYIGVSFYQRAAKFDGGKGVEPGGEARRFVFSDDAEEKKFSFESYIIRSAPCNPDESGNC
jgi:hypothetical protein